MSWRRCLAAVFLVVGVILSPPRATAATIPMLVASVAVTPPTVTTHAETPVPLRQRTEEARTTALARYDSVSTLPVTAAPCAIARESHGYDDGLRLAEAHDRQGEEAIYDAGAAVPAAEGAGAVASNAANAPRLAMQLATQEAESAFTATGELSQEAVQGARQIIPPGQLGNPAIPQGFGKLSTQTSRAHRGRSRSTSR